ncbi:hypothetical protein EV193_10787 [Herbihabitans rhizosphaerae]|uniref:Uncharacterized protein n=1 Tax=Herbihabitans rhizosphaerae TaxID=1872711 RepID=A0A4Q7KJP0_9PSEU|nr:hypothetical protein [Herbihabitans rhizosphaerae]RZS36406.1 hypothetical protein EV193_10787 [Herbihabitans rhizosphaerae]
MDQPTFDLHSALAAMADYPAMLRRLGVIRVIEVDLAGSGIDPSNPGGVTVSATPSWTYQAPAGNVRIAPVATPVHLTPARFALLGNGLLDAVAEKLGVAEIDVDSAATRLLDLARQLVDIALPGQAAIAAAGPLADRLTLPALRNAGLSLTQAGRAMKLRGKLAEAGKWYSATGGFTLSDAQHAVKGYVVDVWDDRTRRWHTLCARRGTYKLPGGRTFTADDEGAVSTAATAKPEAGTGTMMYLHESMVRWNGWSLVAPPVGTPVTTESPDRVPKAAPASGLPGFEVSFVPQPGTLPVLRFGRGYRFQMRAVDVIGRADPLNPTSTDFSRSVPPADKPPARHLRFDPVAAPIVVPSAPMTEGESVDIIVLRPDPGVLGFVSNLLAPLLGTPPVRHLAPPKVSVGLCEEHGMVDTAAGRPDPSKYQMLATRDRADLTAVGTVDPRQPHQRYVPGTLTVAWLPDPICRGAVVSGYPSGPVKGTFDPPLLGSWPNIQPVRLQVVEGTGDPGWNPLLRLITLPVPRGETRIVQLSSCVNAGDLPVLGQVAWMTDKGTPPDVINATRADLQAGQVWQVTPRRQLTLVNAVRTPVTAPSLVNLGNDSSTPRTPGSTVHALVGDVGVHRPSTGQIALVASRTDPVDDPAAPEPTTRTTVTRPPLREANTANAQQAPALPVDYEPDPVTGAQVSFAATHVIGDTRRHQVSYHVEGTTRYLEHFVQRGEVTFAGQEPLRLAEAGIVAGTATVRSLDGETAYREDADFDVDERAGTIKRSANSGIPDNTKVEAAIVVPPATKLSDAVTLDLPSTARPEAPQVAWVVPTFGWTETSADLGLRRTRVRGGGGLRIFLERPWYSSGAGEQLAIVLAGGGPIDPNDVQLRELVTQIGGDPVVKSEAITGSFPGIGQFPLAADGKPALSLPELAGRTPAAMVAAAVHDVQWDAERRRWACDVVLPAGRVYQPFVRLALARYQPNSLAGVELSAVAALQWAQLAPDRSATIRLHALDLTRVDLTVAGWSTSGTRAAPTVPNTVSAILQTSSVGNPGDLDWTTVGSPDGLPLTAATQPDGTTVWSSTIRLPRPRILALFRLVITEQEQHDVGGRLVYSDVIRI